MKPICVEWEERLSLYVDGLLNPFDENAVEAHLSRCEACRSAVALWREIGQSVRRLPRELPPPDLRARILASTTRKPSFVQRLRLGWWQLAPALGVGLLLAYWTLPRSDSRPTPMASQPTPAVMSGSDRSTMSDSSDLSDLPDLSDMSERMSQPRPPQMETRPADSDTRVVIVVQPASAPRWQEPSPRWVISPRAPAPFSPSGGASGASTSETVAISAPREGVLLSGTPSSSPLLTEVADLPVQTEPEKAPGLTSAPERPNTNTATPSDAEKLALIRWSEQFNRQLQQENSNLRLKQATRTQRDSRFFVPILSWNIK